MDEPDADELAWMACQQMPDEDEEFYDDADNLQLRASHPAPEDNAQQSLADETLRKRLPSDISEHPLVKENGTAAKRIRTFHHAPSPPEVVHMLSSSPGLTTRGSLLGDITQNDSVKSPLSPEAFRPADHLPFRMVSSIDGDCMPVTGPSGDRVYAKLNRSDVLGNKPDNSNASTIKGLLVQPIDAMFEQAEEQRVEKMSEVPAGDLLEQVPGHRGGTHEQLWVEKYSPKSFTDLLSDEQTNRQVLRWLKQWDSCVFGQKTNSSTSTEVLVALRRKMVSSEGRGYHKIYKQGQFSSRKMATDGPFKNHSTSWTPKELRVFKGVGPQTVTDSNEKVLLLCGPPGLGKTTLAHVAAKHCGYRIVEINASDDRVAATLQGKILDAVQMKSVTGDCRPNCLIIDEIDGAVGGAEGRSAIKQLVDIVRLLSSVCLDTEESHFAPEETPSSQPGEQITAATKKNAASEEDTLQDGPSKKPAKKRKTAAIQSLVRPIICICNDLYAPALRPLRQIARVHMFSRPSASRVVTRLKHICEEEGFKTNIRALTTLAEYAESDIRACLNTLQFLKRKGKPLTSVDVGSHVVGSKDMTRSIYDIWGEVFRKIETPSRRLMHQQKPAAQSLAQDQLQFLRVYELIANQGDHELALDGIYENLLHRGYQDTSLSKTVECLHSIGDSDIRNNEVHSKQRYFLNGYQPSTPITIRSLVAAPGRPNIQWPRAFQRYKTELAGRREMLNAWFNRMLPALSRSISINPLTLDVVSPLLTILSPPLRPVAVQLYTNAERESMKQLVDTMTCFGLTYKHDKMESLGADGSESNRQGQGQVHLDPPVNVMVNFEGHKVQHRQLSTTLCHILGREIELERIRRESLPMIKPDDLSTNVKRTSNRNLFDHVPNSRLFNPDHKRKESEMKLQTDIASKGDLQSNFPHPGENVPASVKDEATTPSVQPGKVKTVTQRQHSFFDGWKRGAQGGTKKNIAVVLSNQRDLRPLLYKFHEGFTNAIRRPMLFREFL